MKPTVRISPYAPLKLIAVAVVKQAIQDLEHQDPVRSVDAALWLTGPEFQIWADFCEMPYADPFKMLTSGAARKLTHAPARSAGVDKNRRPDAKRTKCTQTFSRIDDGPGPRISEEDLTDSQ
jgi:hypothetical protein